MATRRFPADTANTKRRRHQLIGAVIGAVVGGVVGGTYAVLEDTRGCKLEVGIPCNKRRYLWAYPVGGAAAGAALGALIARF